MAKLLSVDSRYKGRSNKGNIFQNFWSWFNSLDRFIRFSVGTLVLIFLAGVGGGGIYYTLSSHAANSGGTAAPNDAKSMILTLLKTEQDNGYDSLANNGAGGLWIDFRTYTTPLQTNGGNCTVSNATPLCNSLPAGHDGLTDVRFLRNMLLYKHLYGDSEFDTTISKYADIVANEFSAGADLQGFLYDAFMDIYRYSGDTRFQTIALKEAKNFYASYDPTIGMLYRKNFNGSYAVNDALDAAEALAAAGKDFSHPEWITASQNTVNFINAHAYNSQYHIYYMGLKNIFTSQGQLNPYEDFIALTDGNGDTNGGSAKPSALGEDVFSLLRIYQITHDQGDLNQAEDILNNSLSSTKNTLGFWDISSYGGYFRQTIFSGTNVQNPGVPTLNNNVKESGRQQHVLEAFHLADLILPNAPYASFEQTFANVLINEAFYIPRSGYLYQTLANWQPTTRNGQLMDYVTTEAMGISGESFLFYVASSITATPSPKPTAIPTPTPDTIPPTVAITNPVNNTFVKNNTIVPITVSASDNVGVTKVSFFIDTNDDTRHKCVVNTAPYTCEWSVGGKPGTIHTVIVKAFDAAGNIGQTSATVTNQ